MNYRYKACCSKQKLKEIRDFVTAVLQKYHLSDVETNNLVLAVDEICANLIIHSHDCNPSEYIELLINVKENEGITFEIYDYGIGFNPNRYQEPSLKEIVKEKKKGGIGLMLVKRIMDDVEFKSDSRQNVCRLYKKFKPF